MCLAQCARCSKPPTMLLTTERILAQSGPMTRRKTRVQKKSSFNQPRVDPNSKLLPMGQRSSALVVKTQVTRRKQAQPLGRQHFTITEDSGMKFITTKSPNTATVIRHDLPLLVEQIDLSRNYNQRLREEGKIPQTKNVRRLFACLSFYCTDQDIERLMAHPNTKSRPDAQRILKNLTGMEIGSVARYGRKLTKKTRRGHSRKKASK